MKGAPLRARPVAAFLLALLVAATAGAEEAQGQLAGELVYSRLTDGTWQVWRKDLATGERAQVTFSPGDKRYPAWVPDGRIAYHTSNYSCRVVGGQGRPDKVLLTNLQPTRDMAWSPDGARVVFSRFRTDLVDSANLWVADAAGKESRMVTREAGIQMSPAWSPDGAEIAYSGGQGYGTYEIYVISADGKTSRQLTKNQAHEFLPAWSPDGKWIAYSSDVSGDYEIWIMHSDGSQAKQLTASPGLDSRPVWSPDGKRIAFTTHRSGRMEIWAMNADGTEPAPLESVEGGACDPAWR